MTNKTKEEELVLKFVNGDESAFNLLAKSFMQRIYWHARRMTGDHFDADDILQEVLLVMYNKLKTFKFESSLYTWVYKITATRTINYLNKKKRQKTVNVDDYVNSTVDFSADILKNIEDKEKLLEIETKLKDLPLKQREVFIMRNYNELSYEEISAITGTSVGALKANYFHALQKLIKSTENI